MPRMSLRSTVSAFLRARDGVSAVEFALVLPVLIVLYIGSVEMSLALTADRKAITTTSTIADLVAQADGSIKRSDIQKIFDASAAIMAPNPVTGMRIIVSTIDFDEDGNAKIGMSEARNASPHSPGSTPTMEIAEEIIEPNSQVIVAETEYDFSTPFTKLLEKVTGITSYTFAHVTFLRPRITKTVEFK